MIEVYWHTFIVLAMIPILFALLCNCSGSAEIRPVGHTTCNDVIEFSSILKLVLFKSTNFFCYRTLKKKLQEPKEEVDALLVSKYEADMDKNRELSAKLAACNRRVLVLKKQLDDLPGQAELAQYQRRFVELYSQGSQIILNPVVRWQTNFNLFFVRYAHQL